MPQGISTDITLTSIATDLANAGVVFAFRYYSTTTQIDGKRLTLAEAEALAKAGITIGVVYEDNPVAISYFSNSRGHQDAVNAYNAALAINQPPGTAIYFAVDSDFAPADVSGSILDYFAGVNRGMNDAANGNATYSIGVYGSGLVCSQIKSNSPFVQYAWLAESTGWTGSKTFSNWDVKQSIATDDLCGLTVDPNNSENNQYEANEAPSDFGGFVPGHSS
jgi:hypothetical protein